jgi:hypothetical protein
MKQKIMLLSALLFITVFLSATSIFIWDNDNDGTFPNPDNGQTIGTEFAIQKALEDNGFQYEINNSLPADLANYDMIFIALGKYCFG